MVLGNAQVFLAGKLTCERLHPQDSLTKMGVDPAAALERARSSSRRRVGHKRERSAAASAGDGMDVDGGDGALPPIKRVHSSKSRCAANYTPTDRAGAVSQPYERCSSPDLPKKILVLWLDVRGLERCLPVCRSMSRGRALSQAASAQGSGLKDAVQKNRAIKMGDRAQRKAGKDARKGEGDRHMPGLKPKHLFSGKRGIGKTDRR